MEVLARHQLLTPIIIATQEAESRRIMVQSQSGQTVGETMSQKTPSQNRAGQMVQVVKHLPRRCEALSSNPSTTKKGKF
jgi:hypothetical protein